MGTMLGVIKTYAQQEGVAAKAGEKIDELGRAIKNDVQTAEDNIREGFTKTGETSPALSKISIEPPSTPATARASDVLT